MGRRYAHIECAEHAEEQLTQEEKDKRELDDYIMKLFGTDFVEPRVQKQIKKYIEINKYTYSGIKKALIYYYEVKHGNLEKANGGIGIVEYIYSEAYRYYKSIWEAQQENSVNTYQKPKEVIIKIALPKKPRKRSRFFRFLDEEKEDD